MSPASYNPRKISKKAANSLEIFGCVEPIVWNKRTGNIVGGHQRYRVLVDAGETHADVSVVDLDEQEEKLLNVTLNNQAIQGEWDEAVLFKILDQLEPMPEFDSLCLRDLQLSLGDVPNAGQTKEKSPEPPDGVMRDEYEPQSRLCDVWICGDHRVMCGDSCDKKDIERLYDGNVPILCVTDPPYGVNYDPSWREGVDLGVGKRSKGKVKNDDIVDWTSVFENLGADVMYCWHAGLHANRVQTSLENSGYEIVSQIVWVKQHFVLSRGDYHWEHEPCWYAVKRGKKHNWQGDRSQTTVWEIKNNNSFGNAEKEETFGHGTQKPIECMLRPILNNSKKGDFVCDPFLGSGTTMMAAESCGRICFGMEIEPRYCDMSVFRWCKKTGKKAIRENDGVVFDIGLVDTA